MKNSYAFVFIKKTVLSLILVVSLWGCSDSNEFSKPLNILNEELIPIGQVNLPFSFETESVKDTLKCTITTFSIRKNDTIQSISGRILKDNLSISIITSPNEFTIDESKFLIHKVKFDILDLKQGNYQIDLYINRVNSIPISISHINN